MLGKTNIIMEYHNFDKIFKHIKSGQYKKLDNFNKDEINIVLKLKFNGIIPHEVKKYCFTEVRTGQHNFRDSIIKRDNFCILSNKHSTICQASHILDFKNSDNQEKYDINNGLLLSNDLHKAFDNNFFTFNHDTCRLEILYDIIKKKNIDINDLYIKQYEGKYIKQLDNISSKKYLLKRNQLVKN